MFKCSALSIKCNDTRSSSFLNSGGTFGFTRQLGLVQCFSALGISECWQFNSSFFRPDYFALILVFWTNCGPQPLTLGLLQSIFQVLGTDLIVFLVAQPKRWDLHKWKGSPHKHKNSSHMWTELYIYKSIPKQSVRSYLELSIKLSNQVCVWVGVCVLGFWSWMGLK